MYSAAYPGNPVLTPPPPGRRGDVEKAENTRYTRREKSRAIPRRI